jgi:hypothetical protein
MGIFAPALTPAPLPPRKVCSADRSPCSMRGRKRRPSGTTTITFDRTAAWVISPRQGSTNASAVEKTPAPPAWKTLRVFHFPNARRRLAHHSWEQYRAPFPRQWRSIRICAENRGRPQPPPLPPHRLTTQSRHHATIAVLPSRRKTRSAGRSPSSRANCRAARIAPAYAYDAVVTEAAIRFFDTSARGRGRLAVEFDLL